MKRLWYLLDASCKWFLPVCSSYVHIDFLLTLWLLRLPGYLAIMLGLWLNSKKKKKKKATHHNSYRGWRGVYSPPFLSLFWNRRQCLHPIYRYEWSERSQGFSCLSQTLLFHYSIHESSYMNKQVRHSNCPLRGNCLKKCALLSSYLNNMTSPFRLHSG